MRDGHSWRKDLVEYLRSSWPVPCALGVIETLDTELLLNTVADVLPSWSSRDAWTLLGGYPYAGRYGTPGPGDRLRLERLRHYLPPMRQLLWRDRLRAYGEVPDKFRAFRIGEAGEIIPFTDPASEERRLVYKILLDEPPRFRETHLALAEPGEQVFEIARRRHSVRLREEPHLQIRPPGHPIDEPPPGDGEPITITRAELWEAAAEMDAIELDAVRDGRIRGEDRNLWGARLERFEVRVRADPNGPFGTDEDWTLTMAGLTHLVGMVGAGKSTIRDVLAFHLVTARRRKVGILVTDVAETLAITARLTFLGLRVAPIIGRSTRERHIYRLHRRQATGGRTTMLDHDHPGFGWLSGACAVDALRGLENSDPLEINGAPCTTLQAVKGEERKLSGAKRGCPMWSACPRHRAARELVEADVWIGNPRSVLHTRVPAHQNAEQMRYLELMARRSDLIIVDEADQVQVQFDLAFAPSVTLYGRYDDSWLDAVTGHKVGELMRSGRGQLTEPLVGDWVNAVEIANAAATRIFEMLLARKDLREWVGTDFFSAFTLHGRLLGENRDERIEGVLGHFRDRPLRAERRGRSGELSTEDFELVEELTAVTQELITADRMRRNPDRLRELLKRLTGLEPAEGSGFEAHVEYLEFTLLLAALHERVNFITWGWRPVESILRLDSVASALAHFPPPDYQPLIAEAPMGDILGFQFILDEDPVEPGGALRLLRYEGLGRQLLHRLGAFCEIDGRPAPNVLLMSATSWAGESTRYHVDVPVTAVLRLSRRDRASVAETTFHRLTLTDERGAELYVSGHKPPRRLSALRDLVQALAGGPGETSKLALELRAIKDHDRRRVLIVVGSYVEAAATVEQLHGLDRWRDRVVQLVPDDAEDDPRWPSIRRGDVARLPERPADVLVAPMLAVERGHNIVVPDGRAAIGSVIFAVRPHPHPDDMSLSVHALNHWTLRQLAGDGFARITEGAPGPDEAATLFRTAARKEWWRLVRRTVAWSTLGEQRAPFTWDALVGTWQVIGRAVRGGVPTRVVFADASFFREQPSDRRPNPVPGLLESMRDVLETYCGPDSITAPGDRALVNELYLPLYTALAAMPELERRSCPPTN